MPKRTRLMLPRRVKKQRFLPLFLDTLPFDVLAIIAHEVIGGDPERALSLSQVNGDLAQVVAGEFDTWIDALYDIPREPDAARHVLFLRNVGAENYKLARQLAVVMGEKLQTVVLSHGLTKKYADLLRVHATGLKCLIVYSIRSNQGKHLTHVIGKDRSLESLCISSHTSDQVSLFAELKTIIDRIERLIIFVFPGNVGNLPFQAMWQAAAAQESKTRSVSIMLEPEGNNPQFNPHDLAGHLHLDILRRAVPPISASVYDGNGKVLTL